jgi:dCTP deaminase
MDSSNIDNVCVLSDRDILKKIYIDKTLSIVPLVDIHEQLGPTSIDIRLGSKFIAEKKTSLFHFNFTEEKKKIEMDLINNFDEFIISPTKSYILHPGDFVLASTFEFIKLPDNILGSLVGRSSWASKGLQIHSSSGLIDPGFRGYITFQLSNTSNTPLELFPMLRIGQLRFYQIF